MVIGLHKKGAKEEVSNYRPISLLPVLSKVFEKVMKSRLHSFFQQNKILSPNQYGFQANKSTEQAILQIQSHIINSLENSNFACSIFLDFAKAFDTVNHGILLKKLHHYGIRGKALEWLESYLTNRKQCVQVGNCRSAFENIKHGVPQGSVLGPLLFLVYINDIVYSSKFFKFLLFADDTSLVCEHSSLKILTETANQEIGNVLNWLKANKLSLNEDKTEFLIFRGPKLRRKSPDDNVILKIHGLEKSEVSTSTYLGVLIDNKLNFIEHMKYLKIKLKKGTSMIAKLRHFVTEKYLKMIYNAHIEPHLAYASTVWTTGAQQYVKKVKNAQKKALCLMKFQFLNKNNDKIFKDCECLSVNNLGIFNTCKLIWNHRENSSKSDFVSYILNESDVTINPRDQTKYIIPHRKYHLSKQCFAFKGL